MWSSAPAHRPPRRQARGRSAAVTLHVVDPFALPRRLWPLNRAPTLGPSAPSIHSQPVVSGLHSPIRVTSAMRSQTASGAAAMVIRACPERSSTVSR